MAPVMVQNSSQNKETWSQERILEGDHNRKSMAIQGERMFP